jgi:hypothetical protein
MPLPGVGLSKQKIFVPVAKVLPNRRRFALNRSRWTVPRFASAQLASTLDPVNSTKLSRILDRQWRSNRPKDSILCVC